MNHQSNRVPFWPVMSAIFFGSFLTTLSTSSINMVLPILMQHFHANLDTLQWTLTGFMLAVGTVSPIAGFLGDRFSYKHLYAAALTGFVVASGLCAAAWNVPSLIAFRILQGIFCGLIVPCTMSIIYQVIPRERQGLAISIWSVSAMLAPALGPTLAGWLIDRFNWQSIFLFNLPVGILGVIIVARLIPYYKLQSPQPFDSLGFLTSILGGFSLLVGFSMGSKWGWGSGRTLVLIGLGILSLAVFAWWELKSKTPLLNVRVFQHKRYTFSVLVNSIITIALYSGSLLTPLFFQRVQGLSALETGLIQLPPALAMAATMLLVGKFLNVVDPRALVASGTFLLGIGSWAMARLTPTTSTSYVAIWMTVRYVGIALSTTPATNTGMMAVPRIWSGHASAINNWLRQGCGALALGLFSTLLTSRVAMHGNELLHAAQSTASTIQPQATALGINDLYMISAILAFVSIPFSFLLRKENRPVAEATVAEARGAASPCRSVGRLSLLVMNSVSKESRH